MPVHGATFLRLGSFLAFIETGLRTFLFFLGNQGSLPIRVELIFKNVRVAWR